MVRSWDGEPRCSDAPCRVTTRTIWKKGVRLGTARRVEPGGVNSSTVQARKGDPGKVTRSRVLKGDAAVAAPRTRKLTRKRMGELLRSAPGRLRPAYLSHRTTVKRHDARALFGEVETTRVEPPFGTPLERAA